MHRVLALLSSLSLLAACGSAPARPESAPSAHVEAPPEPPHDPDAERDAREAYARCGTSDDLPGLPERYPGDEEYSELTVGRDADGVFVVRHAEWGNGVEASYGGFAELFDPRSCARLRFEWGSTDGDILRRGGFRWRNRGAPSAEEMAHLTEARLADPASPSHGFARMRLLARCPGFDDGWREIDPDRTWDVLGPLAEPQPWLPGVPAAPVESFWPETLLASIGALEEEGEEDVDEGAPQLEGSVVPAAAPPELVRAVGAMELHASRIRDRNGALAFALYDPARDRHRWIALTRGCVNGTEVEWIAEDGELLVGVTRSRHPVYEERDGVLVIDAAAASAYVLEQSDERIAVLLARDHPGPASPAETAAWALLRARLREVARAR